MQNTVYLEPLNGQIVVRRHASPRESSGEHGTKIVIPDQAQKESQKATVIRVWREYLDANGESHRPKVQPDDTVFMPRYCGQQFELDDGEKIVFLKESELLGVIRRGRDYQEEPVSESEPVNGVLEETAV